MAPSNRPLLWNSKAVGWVAGCLFSSVRGGTLSVFVRFVALAQCTVGVGLVIGIKGTNGVQSPFNLRPQTEIERRLNGDWTEIARQKERLVASAAPNWLRTDVGGHGHLKMARATGLRWH